MVWMFLLITTNVSFFQALGKTNILFLYGSIYSFVLIIAIAAGVVAKAQLKKVYEWGMDICILHGNVDKRVQEGRVLHKGQCYECWQDLLEEIK